MTRLVYTSNNTIAHQVDFELELDRLIKKARFNNDRDGITGCLLYSSLCFAQVLEGPEDQVRRTFARIQQDPRHERVFILQFKSTTKRLFEHWSMMFYKNDERLDPKTGLEFRLVLDRPDLDRSTLLEVLTVAVVAETRRLEAYRPATSSEDQDDLFGPALRQSNIHLPQHERGRSLD